MRRRPRSWLVSVVSSAALLALATCHRAPARTPAPRVAKRVHAPAPARENARGIVGGPRDESAFEFDVEPASVADQPPVLEGVPPLPPELEAGLAPYLEARRTRISSIEGAGPALVVLTRVAEVAQAYRVDTPLGPFEQLTRGNDPVAQAVLAPGDAGRLLLRRDTDGNERFQIFRVDIADGREERLTDGESRHGPFTLTRAGTLAFASNRRAPGDMDVYVAPTKGQFAPRRLVERGGQWMPGAWSPDGSRLLVRHYRSADSSSVYVADVAGGALSQLTLDKGEAVMRDARFAAEPDKVYVVSDGGGDAAELHELNLATGASRSLSSGIPWDIELVAVPHDRSRIAFAANEDGVSVLYVVDPITGARSVASGVPRGVMTTLQFVGTTNVVAFTLSSATEPADAYLYDVDADALVRWTESESDILERKPFVEPTLVRYPSHDGLEVPAYVYRPEGAGPFPVLLWIHGGPEEQHRPAFDPLLQYFVVERNIAVVAPNIRGSAGYGRRYLGLDDGMRRTDAIGDVGALLDWIDAQPELDASRVGIYGASYGGYVVLASLVEYGQRLRAGCDLVGVSHFVTLLENTSDYRRDLRRSEYGDERDPEMRAYLERISPLTHAGRIHTPMLVGHGQNDPRVPVGEAEQIVAAARAGGADVWYVLARDEGHGFRKRRSRDAFYSAMAMFFATHLASTPAAPAADAGPVMGTVDAGTAVEPD